LPLQAVFQPHDLFVPPRKLLPIPDFIAAAFRVAVVVECPGNRIFNRAFEAAAIDGVPAGRDLIFAEYQLGGDFGLDRQAKHHAVQRAADESPTLELPGFSHESHPDYFSPQRLTQH